MHKYAFELGRAYERKEVIAATGIEPIPTGGDWFTGYTTCMRPANPSFRCRRDHSQWHACEEAGQARVRIRGAGGLSSSAATSIASAGFQFHGSIASRSFMRAVGSRSRISVR